MCFLHKIGSFFSQQCSMDYHALNKKADDLCVEEAESWKKNFPIELVKARTDHCRTRKEANKFAQEIIKGINFPITDSNFELIKVHLHEIAKKDERLREILVNKVEKLKADKNKIKSLQSRLILTYSKIK